MIQVLPALAIALITVALLATMSLRANRRFEAQLRLPMQWALDGSVNWSAPRGVALAFTPALAAACLALIVVLTAFAQPKAGQEGLVLPVIVLVALGFLCAHAFHLRMIRRTVQRKG